MSFSIIACIGRNRELGKDGKLIWHLSGDMKFFKQTTLDHKIVMGRKTWESLPGKLPNRDHYVITRNQLIQDNNINSVKDINNFIDEYKNSSEEIFIIGGESIYTAFLPYVNVLYLTIVDAEDSKADTYFPTFNEEDWHITELQDGCEEGISYTINKYERK